MRIRLTESQFNNLLMETIIVSNAKVSAVPINWGDPKYGKYSGQLKVVYKDMVYFYKLKVDTLFYDGGVLIKNLWETEDGYGVKDSTGKTFNIDTSQMNDIISFIKKQLNTFTIKSSSVDLTLTKTV
jgi:hypothetical protein